MATAAGQPVSACAAAERVVAGAAEEGVGVPRADEPFDALEGVALGVTAAGCPGGQVDVYTGTGPAIPQRVATGAAIEAVGARVAGERIVTLAAGERVVAGAALQTVRRVVAGHLVIARPGDEVLDHRVAGDDQVAGQAQHVRDPLRAQVDSLVVVVPPQVKRVVAGGVVDRQRHRIVVIDVGVWILAAHRREKLTEIAAHVAAVAIYGVAGVDAGGHPVEVLDRDDVRDHRRDGPGKTRVDVGVLRLAEVRHHRHLFRVVQELGVVRVGNG